MKKIELGTKEESICPSCQESKNNCHMMFSLIRTNSYLKRCGGYKGERHENIKKD